jgi:hypothetical protein
MENEISIPKKPNEDTLILLVRAKLLLEHAITHSHSDSDSDIMITIHNLDNTIEYLLRIIIIHLDIETISNKNFDNSDLASLAGEINGFLKEKYNEKLPYFSDIKLLRKIRNLVQHAIISPKTDLKRFVKITENFFSKVLKLIFGLNKDELRISTLIDDDIIKNHLIKAEKYLDENNYLLSVVSSRDAFENAMFNKIKDSNIKFNTMEAVFLAKINLDYMSWFYSTVSDEIELLRLGVEYPKYKMFKYFLDHIPSEYRVESSSYGLLSREWEINDAKFCYGFVSDALLRWQSDNTNLVSQFFHNDYVFSNIDYINEVCIKNDSLKDGYTIRDDKNIIQLLYLSNDEFEGIKKLEKGVEYKHKSVFYVNGVMKQEGEVQIMFLDFSYRLITNDPIRWEVIICYKEKE